jgi:exodeoxyribonuclease VIII
MTPYEYHSCHSFVSHSMIEVFRRSRQEYHARYVDHTIPADPPTASMRLGTAVHVLLLRPEAWEDEIVVHRATASLQSKSAEQCIADNPKKTVITEDEHDRAIAITEKCASIKAVVKTSRSTKSIVIETPIFWTHELEDIACKCMPDVHVPGCVIDLKTSANPTEDAFARDCARYGYHRQAAWYLDGIRAAGIKRPTRFVHLAIATSEPFREPYQYELGQGDVDLARDQNEESVRHIKACMNSGDWRDEPQRGIVRLRLPRWAIEGG